MNKKHLDITLVLVSDSTFDIEIYEPESGDLKIIKCHDEGHTVEFENQEIVEEIRSWISMAREEMEG